MKPNRVYLLGVAATTFAVAAASSVGTSQAADIRSELPANLIAQHCIAKGVGSNEEGVFLLPGGKRLTGSILCTDADMLASPKSTVGEEADDDGNENEDEDD